MPGVTEKADSDYAAEKPQGKKFVTNQHLVCVVDGAERDYWFGMVSNSVVSEVCNGHFPFSDAI